MVPCTELAIRRQPKSAETCVHELRPPPYHRPSDRFVVTLLSSRALEIRERIFDPLFIDLATSKLPSFLLFVEEIVLGGVGKQLPATMTGKEILHKIKAKAGFASSSDTGKGKCKVSGRSIRHGYHLVKGKSSHPMEDYLVAEFKKVNHNELGLFAVFDGHLGHSVADYLRAHLFENILKEPEFFSDIETAIRKAYDRTDNKILEKTAELGRGGSTAVTAILINGSRLVVANVGDSRAVLSKNGVAIQLSIDHEPSMDREMVEEKGGFVSNIPGDVPRVDGQLAVTRAFGDGSLKKHLSSEPHVVDETVDDDTELLILASDGLWKVMSNQEAVDFIKDAKDPQTAAKNLTEEAVVRKSKDDISCIVVKFN